MKKRYRILIEGIGILIIVILLVSLIQDFLLILFGNINYILLGVIRFVLSLIIIYVIIKTTNFGKEFDEFVSSWSKRSKT